jgi:hypothetical protein
MYFRLESFEKARPSLTIERFERFFVIERFDSNKGVKHGYI